MNILAGDIGGTKTTLAVFPPHEAEPLAKATFPSSEYASLVEIVAAFRERSAPEYSRACFAVAGPVIDGRANVTNLPWVLETDRLRDALQTTEVTLLNDLEATAYSIPSVSPAAKSPLQDVEPTPRGNVAVLAPGTGLGEAFLTWEGESYRAHASEGGHADFAPTNDVELRVLEYLLQKYDHVSYERVCSGTGLPVLYEAIRSTTSLPEPEWLTKRLAAAEDPTPVISDVALQRDPPCELCEVTLRTFTSILGSRAGNLGLSLLATGGVYVAGGIPPRILPALQDGTFMKAFLSKGRMQGLMTRMPVHVVLNPEAALYGAACYAFGQ